MRFFEHKPDAICCLIDRHSHLALRVATDDGDRLPSGSLTNLDAEVFREIFRECLLNAGRFERDTAFQIAVENQCDLLHA